VASKPTRELKDGDVVDSGNWKVSGTARVFVSGDARVEGSGNARIWVSDDACAWLMGDARAFATDTAGVRTDQRSRSVLLGRSRSANTTDRSHAEAHGHAVVHAYGRSRTVLRGSSRAWAHAFVRVEAVDRSSVDATHRARLQMHDQSTVISAGPEVVVRRR
jgi:hypothetical protein